MAIVKHWDKDEYLSAMERVSRDKVIYFCGIERGDSYRDRLREIKEESGYVNARLSAPLAGITLQSLSPG